MEAEKNLYSLKSDFYKGLVNQSQDLILVLDVQGNYKYVSDSVFKILGYLPEELTGTNALDLVHADDKPGLLAVLQNMPGTEPDKVIDYRYKAKNGDYLWLGAVFSNQVHNPAINGLLLNIRDITERKELQFNFQQRKQRFKALFENSPDIIIYENTEGVMADANQAFQQFSGLTKEELIGKPFAAFLDPAVAPVSQMYFEVALVGKTSVRYDLELKTREGVGKIFDTIKFPVVVNGQTAGVYTVAKDMTPIMEAYETIQRQAKKLNTIFESITDAFFTLDTDLNFTYINKEFGKILQVNPETLIGTYIWDFFNKELSNEFLDQYYTAKDYRQAVHFEAFYKRLNLWLEVKAFPSDEGMSVYFSDITRQKRIELQEALGKKILEQNTRPGSNLNHMVEAYLTELQNLYPGMIASVMQLEDDRIFTLASPSLPEAFKAAIHGAAIGARAGSCGTAAFLKQKIIVSDIANDPLWADFKQYALEHNLRACWSLPIIGSNQKVLGTFAIYYTRVHSPAPEEEEAVEKARNVLQLIMENNLAAKALQVSNERFKLVANATEDVIYDWDLVVNSIFWSESIIKLFGIEPAELVYSLEYWQKFAHPEDEPVIMDTLNKALADPETLHWQMEYRIIRAGGEVIYVIDKGNIIRDENGQAIRMVGAMHDITNRKRSELEREHLIAELQQRNKALQQFTHIVSHNLRAPVARILGLTSVFNMPQADPVTKEKILKGIEESAQNVDSVIKDLNQILTIRKSIDQLNEKLWFEEELNAVTKLIKEDLDRNEVTLLTDFTGAKSVTTVRSYLQSILYNLLTNAIKYRRPDKQPEITVSGRTQDGYTVLTVTDNGLGIDLNRHKERIFGLYKRFHAEIDGKGLGLFLVKSQIEALGGKVEVQSKVNEGTTFEVYFKE